MARNTGRPVPGHRRPGDRPAAGASAFNGMAITSLVLGIVAIVTGIWIPIPIPIPILGLVMMFLAFLPAVLAVIFGHVGLRSATRLGGIGRGASLTGLILGYVTLGISVITTFLWIVTAAAASSSGQ
jgi:hypothetical protein